MAVCKERLGTLLPPSQLWSVIERDFRWKTEKITLDQILAEKAYTFCRASWRWVGKLLLFLVFKIPGQIDLLLSLAIAGFCLSHVWYSRSGGLQINQ